MNYTPGMIFQADVQEFHEAMGQTVGDYLHPALADHALRADLITEEYSELMEALGNDDLIEAVDAMCDLIYVVLGTAVAAGVELIPAWYEVHGSNMQKAHGPVGENGKRLKPPDWEPPDIEDAIRRGTNWAERQLRALESMPEVADGW